MRKPKSVCVIVTHEVTATTFLPGYLQHLVNRGWHTAIVASSSGRLEALGARVGAAAFNVPMNREPAPLKDLRSLLQLVVLLSKLRPEIVVVATPKAGLLGMLAARLTGVPIRVYQIWGLRLEGETGWRRRVLHFLERVACRSASDVLANSRSLSQEVERLRLASSVRVLGDGSSHGVDISFFDRTRPDIEPASFSGPDALDENLPVVGYVGRLHEDKGISTLLEAIRLCRNRGVRINLLIVGANENEAIEAEVRQLRAEGYPVARIAEVADTRPYYSRMDVLCLPTLREGFPNVVLESAAMEVPSITTMATGARDSVIDGETGLLTPVGDVHRLAEAIISLASNPARMAQMGRSAREHVSGRYASGIVLKHQEEFLAQARMGAQSNTLNGARRC